MSQAASHKPSLALRALRLLGLSKYEIEILTAVRTLAGVLLTAPKLARHFLKMLPEIQKQILFLEETVVGRGLGRDRLNMLVSWLLDRQPVLKQIASLAEVMVVTRAIATLFVSAFNESGLFPEQGVAPSEGA